MEAARRYSAKEFVDYRRKQPAPYREQLRFSPGRATADCDQALLSDEDLQRASEEGERREQASS